MNKAVLLARWLKKEKSIISKIYLLALLQGALYITIPLGLQGIITYIMAGSFSASLVLLSLITTAVTAFIGFFQLWQMRINETLHQKIFCDLSSRIGFFLNNSGPSPTVLKKLNRFMEVVALQKGISKILLDFSFSVISIAFGLIILPVYSTWFLLITMILSLILYLIIRSYGKASIESNLEASTEKYRLLEWFQQYAGGRAEGDALLGGTDEHVGKYLENRSRHYATLEKQYKGIIIFKIIFIAVLLFFGAFLVQRGDLNLGQFVASEIIIILVINSVEKLVSSLNTCYDLITALTKLEGIFGPASPYSVFSKQSQNLPSQQRIYTHPYSIRLKSMIVSLLVAGLVIMVLPWTQTIQAEGSVSTLNPENRPQTITSRIPGRVEKWYIREGDRVKKNDTIAFISEIKEDYVDPQLISRTEDIIRAKETSLESYEQKVNAVNSQIDALNRALYLKMQQTRNKLAQARMKVSADSTEAITSGNNYLVAQRQLQRYEELVTRGVVSQTDLESRRVKVQESLAKKTSADNKFLAARNELLNAEIELNAVQQEYQEKLMKAESDKFSALSLLYDGEGALTKLQNQLSNYSMRRSFYYVLAPQNGYIAKTHVQGLGEIIKEGAALCDIVPAQDEQAVELYVDPIDLPLVHVGQTVQLQFDGWPAFVFSGWPGMSYGTYEAEIVAFDRVLSANGKFRVLAKNNGDKWPEAIQIGGGVKGMALLNNVPVVYELWRKINGFPPEFYEKNVKTSAP